MERCLNILTCAKTLRPKCTTPCRNEIHSEFFSGITRGRVSNGEFYVHRLKKLIYLYVEMVEISSKFVPMIGEKIFMKQSVNKNR